MAHVAYRVYTEKYKVERADMDEKGYFDGWASYLDEWIPLYSPRIK